MTVNQTTGAPTTKFTNWETIPWETVNEQVKRLQMRIAKATKEKRYGKVKALQRILTCSYYAKLLAVKRVTDSRGSKTAGVDQVIWETPKQKMTAVKTLKRRGYKPQPLRRVYIPKKQGKQRPLGIPILYDRAQQALYLQALEPVAETQADIHSYGFRPYRNCMDAIEQCFRVLAKKRSAQWVLEGDIKACFDNISHEWIMAHIPMDKQVLGKWLKAGYVYKNQWRETSAGTPQGGVISPTLANMVLDGMNSAISTMVTKTDKVHLVRYADDFIVTGNSKELLENKIKPAIVAFLKERGLILSEEKTRITHIDNGFDFLGFNIRKYNGKLLTKPSNASVKSFLADIKQVITAHQGHATIKLLLQINPKIRGWVNYYKHSVAQKCFEKVDHRIFWLLWQWAERRHPNKGRYWVKDKYFMRCGHQKWVFATSYVRSNGEKQLYPLYKAGYVPIRRHIKVKAETNPFLPEHKDYFKQRRLHSLWRQQNERNRYKRQVTLLGQGYLAS